MQKLVAGDPQRIGAYRLIARLGAGGMGNVYLARSDRGRTVAVKLVRRELARQDEFRARFRQEVQAARRVGGHWTAPVLDADTEAEIPWVATGYVAGPTLQTVVSHEHGALPERSVRILAAGLAHALQDIHAAGLVHRDLKPSNVLVTIDGPRVIDFGIARALETVTAAGLTRTGALVGSPGFMAPEQVRGDRITPACDVFCLGSVLAYAATGTLPFGASHSGAHALMFRIAEEDPDLTGMPEELADLVRDCLRKDPAARPTPAQILERTGAGDTVSGGRTRDPWLPSALVAQLGRHAVRLLDAENPEDAAGPAARPPAPPRGGAGAPASAAAVAGTDGQAADADGHGPLPTAPAPAAGGRPSGGGPVPGGGGWPPGVGQAPGVSGQASGGVGQASGVSGQAPGTGGQAPGVGGRPSGGGPVPGGGGWPPGVGQAPGVSGQASGGVGQASGVSGQASGGVGQASGVSGQAPGTGGQASGTGGQASGAGGRPAGGGPVSGGGGWPPGVGQAPGVGGQASGGVGQASGTGGQAPGAGGRPSGGGPVPGGGGWPPGVGQAPGVSGQASGGVGQASGGVGQAPGVSGQAPGTGGQASGVGGRPGGGQAPDAGAYAPADGRVPGGGVPVGAAAAGPGPGVPEAPVDLTKRSPADAPAGAPPEHAPAPHAPDGSIPPPSGPHTALDHLPTQVVGPGHNPAPPPYGHPQQSPQQSPQPSPSGHSQHHPQPSAYTYPQNADGWAGTPAAAPGQGPALGPTPAYGPPPYGSSPYGPPPYGSSPYGPSPYGDPGPQAPPRRSGRSTAVLIVVALVVALGAGGSVYALMRGGGTESGNGAGPSHPSASAPTTPGPSTPAPSTPASAGESPGSPSPTAGAVPDTYLGTWTTAIDNSTGHNTRRLVIQQGEVGDTVLSLTADGPTGGGTYHCVFRAKLDQTPTTDGPLMIGPSTVTVGEPASSCTPGAATELTILPDGRLKRVSTSSGDSLTYTKEG